jgi:superfamily I DNA and/or RNA helicase
VHSLDRFTKSGVRCVAAWINVPATEGAEQPGRSKSRPSEARKVAAAVMEILASHHGLTIGVIAFYAAQVEEICRELAKRDIMERDETDSNWVISSQYALTTNSEGKRVERLRVGTVDAFQGKEFDVVFLSMTRSNRITGDTDLELRRKFGHLLVENRMCVAMSRQQRLLVMVGDAGMANAPTAPRPLKAFYEFCRGEHGIVL